MEVFLKSRNARFKRGLSSDMQENWLCDKKVAQTVTHDSSVTFQMPYFQLTKDF